MMKCKVKTGLGILLLLCLSLTPAISRAEEKPAHIKIQQFEISDAVDQPCMRLDIVFTDNAGKAAVVSEEYSDKLVIKENGRDIPTDHINLAWSASKTEENHINLVWSAPKTKENEKIGFADRSRDAMTILMIVDTSASMGYSANTSDGSKISKIEAAKRAIQDFVERKSRNDRIAIMPFSSIVPSKEEIKFLSDKDEIIEQVEELAERGATSLNRAVDIGLQILQDESGRRVIMLLSDGIDSSFNPKYNVPVQNRMHHDDLVPIIEGAGIQINVIGFGNMAAGSELAGLMEKPLREMTEASGTGEYVFADDAQSLIEIYKGFAMAFLSEVQVYYISNLSQSDLINNVDIEIASRGIRNQKTRFNFSGVTGTLRTAKESFARSCEKKILGEGDGKTRISVKTTNPKVEFRKATIIFLLIATTLGVMLALPFLFGKEAMTPDREPVGHGPSAAMRPVNQPGQSAINTGLAPGVGYRPGGAATHGHQPQSPVSGPGVDRPVSKPTAGAQSSSSAKTQDASPQVAPEPTPKASATSTVASETNYETPYFEFTSETGQICHLLIHPDYNDTPINEAFLNVLEDYQNAGQFVELTVLAEAFFARGSAVEGTQTVNELDLEPGVKIGVLTE
jgi:Mg-chelatase subunit ChlD